MKKISYFLFGAGLICMFMAGCGSGAEKEYQVMEQSSMESRAEDSKAMDGEEGNSEESTESSQTEDTEETEAIEENSSEKVNQHECAVRECENEGIQAIPGPYAIEWYCEEHFLDFQDGKVSEYSKKDRYMPKCVICGERALSKLDDGQWYCYKHEQEKLNPPKPEEPRIGMTADEVERSTWGEPEEINRTTYSWGTQEQWVYSGGNYIYLEDGVVTAIQESK